MPLPCNVVVKALDPAVMVTVPGRQDLRPVTDEAGQRLHAALAAVSTG
ncbi:MULTISPECIES: hypothetical protein [Amycolatopsis]|nr:MULTISPECIES: hypothetical protein [Amycolatopsis]